MVSSKKDIGYIYVLSNPAMPNFLKIGYTSNSVENRRAQLSNTAVPLPYIIEHQELVENPNVIERLIHARLNNYRVAQNREFFELKVDHAIEEIIKIIYGVKNIFDSLIPSLENLVYLVNKYPNRWDTSVDKETMQALLKAIIELNPENLAVLEKHPSFSKIMSA